MNRNWYQHQAIFINTLPHRSVSTNDSEYLHAIVAFVRRTTSERVPEYERSSDYLVDMEWLSCNFGDELSSSNIFVINVWFFYCQPYYSFFIGIRNFGLDLHISNLMSKLSYTSNNPAWLPTHNKSPPSSPFVREYERKENKKGGEGLFIYLFPFHILPLDSQV